jgi:hypothetical protein
MAAKYCLEKKPAPFGATKATTFHLRETGLRIAYNLIIDL